MTAHGPALRIAVSGCLAGEPVRYDGAHRRVPFLVETLGEAFELVPICPEVAVGLGVPRAPIELVEGDGAAPRVLGVEDRTRDVGAALERYAREQARALGGDICGYVFKARSPSCGLFRVPLHDLAGRVTDTRGRGAYARGLLRALPWLPAVEEWALDEPARREHFIERVLVLGRWRRELAAPDAQRLRAFHDTLLLSLLARGAYQLRTLSRLCSGRAGVGRETSGRAYAYRAGLMRVLARPVSPRGHRRAMGRALRLLPPASRRGLSPLLRAYANGELPLAVPIDALRRAAPPDSLLARQQYLAPFPAGLRPREALWARG